MADILGKDNSSSEDEDEMHDCEINQEHSHYAAEIPLEDRQEGGNTGAFKISDKLSNNF